MNQFYFVGLLFFGTLSQAMTNTEFVSLGLQLQGKLVRRAESKDTLQGSVSALFDRGALYFEKRFDSFQELGRYEFRMSKDQSYIERIADNKVIGLGSCHGDLCQFKSNNGVVKEKFIFTFENGRLTIQVDTLWINSKSRRMDQMVLLPLK